MSLDAPGDLMEHRAEIQVALRGSKRGFGLRQLDGPFSDPTGFFPALADQRFKVLMQLEPTPENQPQKHPTKLPNTFHPRPLPVHPAPQRFPVRHRSAQPPVPDCIGSRPFGADLTREFPTVSDRWWHK